jgi:hypothetical protein
MKMTPFLTALIVLTPGVALVTGYALLSNPSPRQATAAFSHSSLSAQPPGVTFYDESQTEGSSSGPGEQSSAGTRAFSGNEPSGGSGSGGDPAQSSRDSIATFSEESYGAQSGFASGQSSSPSAPASAAPQAPASVPIPLAFRPLPPHVAATNPQLAAAVQGLQQNFINALGGPNQNPNDPAYFQRWLTAQEINDEQYRLLVGDQNYLMEQMSINGKE